MASEEDLPVYTLTITPDHRLEVNGAPVEGEDILPGDSEALLAWGMDQVSIQHQMQPDTALQLNIDDRRPGGYGTLGVRMFPGAVVSIEHLRQQTGKDLSYISQEVEAAQRAHPTPPPPEVQQEEPAAPAAEPLPDVPTSAEEPREEEPPVATAEAPSENAESAAPLPDVPAIGSPEEKEGEEGEEEIAPIPFEEESEARPHVEAAAEQPALPEAPPLAHDPEGDSFLPLLTDIDDRDDDWATEPTTPTPVAEQSVAAAQQVDASFEDLSSAPVIYERDRPRLGEAEAEVAVEIPARARRRIRILSAAVIVLVLVVGFFGARFIMETRESTYVATCIDERTMERQATEEPCETDGAASYYRWWYTPSGSAVPAVGQAVDPSQGTRVKPSNAQIVKGYDEEGRPANGEDPATTEPATSDDGGAPASDGGGASDGG